MSKDVIRPQWISVDDALPGLGERVVVLARAGFDGQKHIFFAQLEEMENHTYAWNIDAFRASPKTPYFWLPLPLDRTENE